jgi:hypothetical protein
MTERSPPTSHHPPAYCASCNFLFPVTGLGVSDGSSISSVNNLANCPRCGRLVKVLDGTYAAVGDALNAVLSPDVSLEARAALMRLVVSVQEKRLGLDEAKRQAEQISPKLGKIFDISEWSGDARAAFLGSVMLTIATLAVAGATVTAPLFSPAPVVQVINAPPPQPATGSRRRDLLSSTAMPAPTATLKTPKDHKSQNADRHTGSKPGAKHDTKKKTP